jgi:hypothetical protein
LKALSAGVPDWKLYTIAPLLTTADIREQTKGDGRKHREEEKMKRGNMKTDSSQTPTMLVMF